MRHLLPRVRCATLHLRCITWVRREQFNSAWPFPLPVFFKVKIPPCLFPPPTNSTQGQTHIHTRSNTLRIIRQEGIQQRNQEVRKADNERFDLSLVSDPISSIVTTPCTYCLCESSAQAWLSNDSLQIHTNIHCQLNDNISVHSEHFPAMCACTFVWSRHNITTSSQWRKLT